MLALTISAMCAIPTYTAPSTAAVIFLGTQPSQPVASVCYANETVPVSQTDPVLRSLKMGKAYLEANWTEPSATLPGRILDYFIGAGEFCKSEHNVTGEDRNRKKSPKCLPAVEPLKLLPAPKPLLLLTDGSEYKKESWECPHVFPDEIICMPIWIGQEYDRRESKPASRLKKRKDEHGFTLKKRMDAHIGYIHIIPQNTHFALMPARLKPAYVPKYLTEKIRALYKRCFMKCPERYPDYCPNTVSLSSKVKALLKRDVAIENTRKAGQAGMYIRNTNVDTSLFNVHTRCELEGAFRVGQCPEEEASQVWVEILTEEGIKIVEGREYGRSLKTSILRLINGDKYHQGIFGAEIMSSKLMRLREDTAPLDWFFQDLIINCSLEVQSELSAEDSLKSVTHLFAIVATITSTVVSALIFCVT